MKRKLGVVLSGCGARVDAAIAANVRTVAAPARGLAATAEAAR